MLLNRLAICLLLVAFACMSGCAASKIISLWRQQAVAVDGNDQEWQGSPQYYDKDRKFVIRATNDARAIFLCVSTRDTELQRTLRMAGMTVWLDPEGTNKHIFGIHLSGGHDQRPGNGSVPPEWNTPGQPPGMFPKERKTGSTPVEPLTDVAITYADTTGPLSMNIEAIRRTGIDIGIGRPGDGRLVYEFKIEFMSAPSLNGLEPGMVLGVGIVSGSMQEHFSSSLSGDKMGLSFGPGGGKGGGPGGPPPGKKNDVFEVWLRVQLAGQSFK